MSTNGGRRHEKVRNNGGGTVLEEDKNEQSSRAPATLYIAHAQASNTTGAGLPCGAQTRSPVCTDAA